MISRLFTIGYATVRSGAPADQVALAQYARSSIRSNIGSGNVFADLGYARPEEAAAKAELAHKITKIIGRRRLTQAEAAELLDVDQPKISALRRGKLTGFSLDRLVRFLVLLGSDVQIVVKEQPRSRRRARLLVA